MEGQPGQGSGKPVGPELKPPGNCRPLAQAEFETVRYFMSVLFAPKREVLERCLASQYFVPIDPVGDLPDLRRRSSSSVDSSDQAPHAGASDIAYREYGVLPSTAEPRYEPGLKHRHPREQYQALGVRS